MGEIEKEPAFFELEPVEQAGVEGADPAERDQQLGRRPRHGHGVDLDAADGPGYLEQAVQRRRWTGSGQPLGMDREAPDGGAFEDQLEGRRQPPAAIQRASFRAGSGRVSR
ncbi:MAG: hypothetical protein NVS9B1_09430 [Candidatus Dormibacteraceae bacterium]